MRLTFCVSVGEEADLGFELARRVCLRHDARRRLVRDRTRCDDFSDDNDMFLVCLCEVRKVNTQYPLGSSLLFALEIQTSLTSHRKLSQKEMLSRDSATVQAWHLKL